MKQRKLQARADGGVTWTSWKILIPHMTMAPSAHPDIIANLPGLTETSVGWPE